MKLLLNIYRNGSDKKLNRQRCQVKVQQFCYQVSERKKISVASDQWVHIHDKERLSVLQIHLMLKKTGVSGRRFKVVQKTIWPFPVFATVSALTPTPPEI